MLLLHFIVDAGSFGSFQLECAGTKYINR